MTLLVPAPDAGAQNAVMDSAPPAARPLDAQPHSAGEARDLAAAYLGGRDVAVPGPVADDVLLVVSELVTNALRHAGGVSGMRVAVTRAGVEVTVRDACGERPVVRGRGGDWLPGGYGWPMVSRLAEVAVIPLGTGGKLVRATVPVAGR
ncbi:ATP-binding protein [Streptomyces sp. NRRL F-5126]|uniref:ATP-binding protein n=1 Tax=Streptomyces sp. NRRL F-5126 TaxID=1463857 RepID=UPI000689EB82|nr:ATP-binding protein [Streptomyces sp. NRRL F-5126]